MDCIVWASVLTFNWDQALGVSESRKWVIRIDRVRFFFFFFYYAFARTYGDSGNACVSLCLLIVPRGLTYFHSVSPHLLFPETILFLCFFRPQTRFPTITSPGCFTTHSFLRHALTAENSWSIKYSLVEDWIKLSVSERLSLTHYISSYWEILPGWEVQKIKYIIEDLKEIGWEIWCLFHRFL